MKRILAMLLAVVMMLSMGVVAFAEETVWREVQTAEALTAALSSGGNIKLTGNIAIGSNSEPLSVTDHTSNFKVESGKTVVFDLNGYSISAVVNCSKNYALISNKGTLTIMDSSAEKTGLMQVTNTDNSTSWGFLSTVIDNDDGGNLTVESGTFKHNGGTSMAYALDITMWTAGSTTINGGTFESTYTAMRDFTNNPAISTTIDINGGTFIGGSRGIWIQHTTNNDKTEAASVSLNISGDTEVSAKNAIHISSGYESSEAKINLTIESDSNGNAPTLIGSNKAINNAGSNNVLTGTVTGGTFSDDSAVAYASEGTVAATVGGETVIGDVDAVNDAIATAESGETVTVLKAPADTKITAPAGVKVENKTGEDLTVNNEKVEDGKDVTIPVPVVKPDPCDHKLDANGKCERCGVVIITYTDGKPSTGVTEENPNTGAEAVVGVVAAIAAVSLAGAFVSKKR